MAWSTRELAELAGTSLRAVRHYHDEGLLPEPPRSSNGYKHYGVRHLIQLMHIRRLVDLGVPLAEIPGLDPSTDSYREVLEALASESTAEIERLVKVRGQITQLLSVVVEPGLRIAIVHERLDPPLFVDIAGDPADVPSHSVPTASRTSAKCGSRGTVCIRIP